MLSRLVEYSFDTGILAAIEGIVSALPAPGTEASNRPGIEKPRNGLPGGAPCTYQHINAYNRTNYTYELPLLGGPVRCSIR